jgi:hypothetical protein
MKREASPDARKSIFSLICDFLRTLVVGVLLVHFVDLLILCIC